MSRFKFNPEMRFFNCRRCRKRVRRTGANQKFCKPCGRIKKLEGWIEARRRKYGYKPRVHRERLWEQEKIIRQVRTGVKPISKMVVEQARRKLLNRRKRRYNIHQIQNLSTEKFGRAVTQCLQDEAVLVGIKDGKG